MYKYTYVCIQLHSKDSGVTPNSVTYVMRWMQFQILQSCFAKEQRALKVVFITKNNKHFIELKLKASISPSPKQSTEKINHCIIYIVVLSYSSLQVHAISFQDRPSERQKLWNIYNWLVPVVDESFSWLFFLEGIILSITVGCVL